MTIIKANYHEMLRMTLKRHRLAHYRRERKQGLVMQLAFIILHYHPLHKQREREMFENRAETE